MTRISKLAPQLAALVLAGSLTLAAHAQTDTGTTGSGTGVGTDTGSGTTGSGTGVGTDTGSGTSASYDSPNTYDLGGGTVTLATAILNGGTVTNGTLAVSSTITGYSGSVSAQLTGAASLTKSNSTTLRLSGTNTYTGTTQVSDGVLLINGSLANSRVTVSSGATLGGIGTIGGPTTLQSGGILSPGDSIGTLTFTGGLTLEAGAVLNFDLGTTSDLIAINGGTLTGPSSGTITLNFTDAGGFGASTYTLFSFTDATLADFDLSDFMIGIAPSGWNYTFNLTAESLTLSVTAVPEPATTGAFAAGIVAVAVLVERRRRLRRA